MTLPEPKQFHKILRTQSHHALVLVLITILAGKPFSWCASQAEQDPWENINTTGIPQDQCLLTSPTAQGQAQPYPEPQISTDTESHNGSGQKRPHWGHLVPCPCSGRIISDHMAQDCVQIVLEYPQCGTLHTLPGQTDTAVLVGLEALESMGTDRKTPVSASSLHTDAELCYVITLERLRHDRCTLDASPTQIWGLALAQQDRDL